MKWLALLVSGSIALCMACGNNRPATSDKRNTGPELDSALIKAIDAFVETATAISDTTEREVYSPGRYSSRDRYVVARKDGKYLRVLAVYYPENGEFRNDYFFNDGELTYVYHREWTPSHNPPIAKEFFMYFEKQQITHLLGHTLEFPGPDPKPMLLFNKPIVEFPMNRDSLSQVMQMDFQRIDDYLKENTDDAGTGNN